jgi:hypothetical protein
VQARESAHGDGRRVRRERVQPLLGVDEHLDERARRPYVDDALRYLEATRAIIAS